MPKVVSTKYLVLAIPFLFGSPGVAAAVAVVAVGASPFGMSIWTSPKWSRNFLTNQASRE